MTLSSVSSTREGQAPGRAAREQLRSDSGRSISVFASLNAQHENLGDLVIRREMIRMFDCLGCELNLYVGRASHDFVDAVLDGRSTVLHRTLRGWQSALMIGAVRRRSVLVFGPGPHSFVDHPRTIGHDAVNLANVLWLRAFGRPAIRIGRSLRGSRGAALLMERWMAQLCAVYTVRDDRSGPVLGRSLIVEPDLAFGMQSSEAEHRRPWVSFSPRVGRDWPVDLLSRLLRETEELGLRPCIVSQTTFDDRYHADLADHFAIEHVAWGERSHAQQLDRVLARYNESSFVVSDRLHGLIFGMIRGATPIPHLTGDDKLIPTLRAVGWPPDAPDSRGSVADWIRWSQRADRPRIVEDAKVVLDESQTRILALIADRAK